MKKTVTLAGQKVVLAKSGPPDRFWQPKVVRGAIFLSDVQLWKGLGSKCTSRCGGVVSTQCEVLDCPSESSCSSSGNDQVSYHQVERHKYTDGPNACDRQ